MRELRNFLRMCLNEIIKDRRYIPFIRPVDPESVPDYYDLINCPMDLETMKQKVDGRMYPSFDHFVRDFDQITFNAKRYNPLTIKDTRGKAIVSNSHGMLDAVHSYAYRFKKNIGYDLFKRCKEIVYRRNIPIPRPAPTAINTKVMFYENRIHYQDILEFHQELKVCLYICMYVCMFVCLFVCLYICLYVFMYVCMFVYMYVYICLYVCMYVCMYVCL